MTFPTLPHVHEKLVEVGLLSRASGEARCPLSEHLDGVIVRTPEFEAEVQKFTRNGATPEHARRRAMAFAATLYSVEYGGYYRAAE